jgi:tRNA A-37 threonylcarbamoyl transferase component Bud32
LNVGFPVWGIVAPVGSVIVLFILIAMLQSGQHEKLNETATYLAIGLCVSLGALLTKRLVAYDLMVVDNQGIKLPRMMGNRINFLLNTPWQNVERITAQIASSDPNRSRITVRKKKGRSLTIPVNQLQPEFIEQFILAARMWAPDRCDQSLEELQNVLRDGARETAKLSYTDLWDEELGRRFCPTAYIPLEPGRVLRNSSLKVINHLASGGLSALYLCQKGGKELVVLKEAVIPENGAENIKEKAREMFDREAKLLMKLDHPGIVKVLDCFTEGERNYLLLEYISGVDLRQLVRQNGTPKESDVLEWAIQIANALKYLHEREYPIIHRDLTPDNIVLRNDGQVLIVDFGAANEFIGNATGTFVGKHSFIAPEQLRGKATVHSDIYAFGCTLHFLLTGVEPEALSPSNPRELKETVSEELAELVQSCTQLEASDRYQSVAQLIPVLRRQAAQSLVV